MGLTARHLESNGIPTVILGSARDVVEHCGVPRFLFTDFPLGNSIGRPYDVEMQRAVVWEALQVLETAVAPRTTVQSLQEWGDDEWRDTFLAIREEDRETLRAAGEAGRKRRVQEKAAGVIR